VKNHNLPSSSSSVDNQVILALADCRVAKRQ